MRVPSIGLMMAVFLIGTAAFETSAESTAPIDRFAWVAGCWVSDRVAKTVIEEQWMAPRDGSMLGMSRTTKDGRLVDYELVIVRAEGARLAYEAHPAGQPMATFLEVSSSDSTQVLFENPTHDFPQRVGYRRFSGDSALAWIEGARNGNVRRIDFPYRRVRCTER